MLHEIEKVEHRLTEYQVVHRWLMRNIIQIDDHGEPPVMREMAKHLSDTVSEDVECELILRKHRFATGELENKIEELTIQATKMNKAYAQQEVRLYELMLELGRKA